jgi:hypothetical protein
VKFSYEEVKQMITHQGEKYSWEFIFLGANIDVAREGNKLGIKEDRAFSFTPDSHGIGAMYSKSDSVCTGFRISGRKQETGTET